MNLLVPIASAISLYFLILIILFVLKNNQKPDSPDFEKYQKIVKIWVILGFAIFLTTIMILGGGPIFFM